MHRIQSLYAESNSNWDSNNNNKCLFKDHAPIKTKIVAEAQMGVEQGICIPINTEWVGDKSGLEHIEYMLLHRRCNNLKFLISMQIKR